MSSASASKLADVLPNSLPPPGAVGAQPVGGGLDRAVQHARAATVERVDAVDLREAPGQAVTIEAQPGQELRADGHRVDRRAVVVQQAGDDRLAGARAPSDVVGGFQDGDLKAGLGEGDRGGQAVRPGPHDDRGAHASPPARSGPRSFLAAILTRARLRVLMPAPRGRDPPRRGRRRAWRSSSIQPATT